MNYYKFNIGDYAAATRHLSFVEHGAYRLLLDLYYTSERPLPADTKAAARIAGARSKEEIQAVQTILEEFFVQTQDGWKHARCDAEIATFSQKAETNRVTGKLGGRPKKETQTVSGINPNGYEKETQTVSGNSNHGTLTTNQEPLTINQEPVLRQDTGTPPPPSRAAAVCVVVKSVGIGAVNPHHPKLIELLADGATVQHFETGAQIAVTNGKGFAYALGVVEGILSDAKRPGRPVYAGPETETFRERDSRLAAERMAEFAPGVARQTALASVPIACAFDPNTIDQEVTHVAAIASR